MLSAEEDDETLRAALQESPLQSESVATLASATTKATESQPARALPADDDGRGPANGAAMLFHPPAAHEQHSDDDSAAGFEATSASGAPGGKEEDKSGSSSVLVLEDGQGKKKRKRKNKKKKKGGANAGAALSEAGDEGESVDDRGSHFIDEERSRSRSTKSRTGDGDTLDFTPLKEKIDDTFFDDQDSSEDEGMPDYKIGGYHPVHVGEILLDRYIIIQKLGWGHFSTVWLTKDLKFNVYVAIKVQKSAQHYLEAAYDEVEILD